MCVQGIDATNNDQSNYYLFVIILSVDSYGIKGSQLVYQNPKYSHVICDVTVAVLRLKNKFQISVAPNNCLLATK